MEIQNCPECGAPLQQGKKCNSYLEQMLGWDFTDFTGVGKVHHLTVLCYYLQHPRVYSKEALEKAKQFLKNIVEQKLYIADLYKEESDVFSSSKRDWKVRGTSEDQGNYSSVMKWSMTASDVVVDGIDAYPKHVRKWAQAIYTDLKKSGELE